uniref:NADH-ubiquinone oxidoreductase chain 5 n=1 Tax=Panthalis oerstedi TaxID=318815 RepID=A0A343W6D7_9ANNE|nr:NADH dehydrogenase subunit 5 [Panthalis oerstedi]
MPHFSLKSSKLLWALLPPSLGLAALCSLNNSATIVFWHVFSSSSATISIPVILDQTGLLFSSAVFFISANVMHFASSYMKGDPFLQRFSHLVLLFVLSMNLLIFVPHMICLLLGWDGLGITSFILVIYYQNPKSLAAGMITALMNRIGDVMILLSIALTLNLGHWSILSIWVLPHSPTIALFILLASMTKSAQMPFSSWLPAAMAAPTPVSALVHSSTLVTAGVFLVIRFYPFLSTTPWFNRSLLIISALTMFMAGMAAISECDMKKIIALSTLSQLGVMMASLGLGLPDLALFHLITHAMFKALLFLTAGSMIHFHHHSQDLRFMGNLPLSSPLTTASLLVANLALCGTPFLAGFYSKDLILEMSLFNHNNILILLLLFLATALTASYTMRFILITTWNSSNSTPFQYTADSLTQMTSPMLLLSLGAVTSGAALNWTLFNALPEPFLPPLFKLAALLITSLGAILAVSLTLSPNTLNLRFPSLHFFNSSMWFLTPLTSQGAISIPLALSHTLLKSLDHGWLEALSGQGLLSSLNHSSAYLLTAQSTTYTAHLTVTAAFLSTLLI